MEDKDTMRTHPPAVTREAAFHRSPSFCTADGSIYGNSKSPFMKGCGLQQAAEEFPYMPDVRLMMTSV